ncbi:hypothetical protein KY315_02810 [Candidatus Woesearchaeota archaeon]|nr:hypothetical protein [Candidatus Woesearchaeota archaeon]
MFDVRKIIIIFVIGILFAIFSYSLIDAIYPAPEYEDYCAEFARPMPIRPPTPGEVLNCPEILEPTCEKGASQSYEYDQKGCVKSIKCNNCNLELNKAKEKHSLFVFILSSALGLLAIGIGLYMPKKKHHMHEWVATGFMLGGLITLLIGTAVYYADMVRIARPIVLFLELVLVIYLAYKKLKK